jgi:hypothetical protein
VKRFLLTLTAVVLFCAAICAFALSACAGRGSPQGGERPGGGNGAETALTEQAPPAPETAATESPSGTKTAPHTDGTADGAAGAQKNGGTKYVWNASRTRGEILDALSDLDIDVATVNKIEILQRAEDGSAAILSVGGHPVDGRGFATALNLESVRITDIRPENDGYAVSGIGGYETES